MTTTVTALNLVAQLVAYAMTTDYIRPIMEKISGDELRFLNYCRKQ